MIARFLVALLLSTAFGLSAPGVAFADDMPLSPIIQDVSGGTLNTVTHIYTPRPVIAPAQASWIWTDGFTLEARLEEATPSMVNQFSKPTPGFRWVFVVVRISNGSGEPQYFNEFRFQLVDSQGVRRQPGCCDTRNDTLNSGTLAPGEKVVGSIMFEAPLTDNRLTLLYDEGPFAKHQAARLPLY
jgi:uncharacterized protein DUF4352